MGAYCRHGNLSGQPCGYCKQDEAKDARIAALESALKLAKEALECPSCDPSDSRVCRALAAIKEARND